MDWWGMQNLWSLDWWQLEMECYLHQKSMDVGGYVTVKIYSLGLLPDAIGCLRASCSSKPPWPFAWPFLEVISGSEDMTHLEYHTSELPMKMTVSRAWYQIKVWQACQPIWKSIVHSGMWPTCLLTEKGPDGWMFFIDQRENPYFHRFRRSTAIGQIFQLWNIQQCHSWNGDHRKIRWKMR